MCTRVGDQCGYRGIRGATGRARGYSDDGGETSAVEGQEAEASSGLTVPGEGDQAEGGQRSRPPAGCRRAEATAPDPTSAASPASRSGNQVRRTSICNLNACAGYIRGGRALGLRVRDAVVPGARISRARAGERRLSFGSRRVVAPDEGDGRVYDEDKSGC